MTSTEVLRLDGEPISWKFLHREGFDPTRMVKWSQRTTGGKEIKGSLRTIAFLKRMDDRAQRRFGQGIIVFQGPYNQGVAASAGTHDADAAVDWWIPGIDPWVQQRFARAQGMADWYRHPSLFSNHQHGFPIPPPKGVSRRDDFQENGFEVGLYLGGQNEDYWNGAFGLANQHTPGSDKSWRPRDIRATVFNLATYIERRAAA